MLPRTVLQFCFAIAVAVVRADKTLVIDGADPAIKYTTLDTGGSDPTWTVVARSPDSCDAPQMLTERVGDYATFTFTGTGVQVVGTIGKKRGILGFSMDGANTTFDRTLSNLQCDSIIFQALNLPYQQHTVMAFLNEKQTSFVNGQPTGVLSIQRIRYTVPGSDGSKSKVPVIVGATVGAVALIAAAVALWFFLRRKKRVRESRSGAFFDTDDVPASNRTDGHFQTPTSGMVATPFQWNGQQQSGPQMQQYPSAPQSVFTPPANYPESNPASPGINHPLLFAAGSASPPHSSSSRSDRYNNRDSKQSYVTSNPDRSSSYNGGSAPEEHSMVDRIAQRLADIMESRAAGTTGDAPPPIYDAGAAQPVVPEKATYRDTQSPDVSGASSSQATSSTYPAHPPPGAFSPMPAPMPQYSHSSGTHALREEDDDEFMNPRPAPTAQYQTPGSELPYRTPSPPGQYFPAPPPMPSYPSDNSSSPPGGNARARPGGPRTR